MKQRRRRLRTFEEGCGFAQRLRQSKARKVGTISKAKIEEIAKTKMPDLNTTSLEAAIRTIEGTARQMGLTVE